MSLNVSLMPSHIYLASIGMSLVVTLFGLLFLYEQALVEMVEQNFTIHKMIVWLEMLFCSVG